MRWVLLTLFFITLFSGITFLTIAKTSVHEIEGLIILLMSVIFLVGSAIVDAVKVELKRLGTNMKLIDSEAKQDNKVE